MNFCRVTALAKLRALFIIGTLLVQQLPAQAMVLSEVPPPAVNAATTMASEALINRFVSAHLSFVRKRAPLFFATLLLAFLPKLGFTEALIPTISIPPDAKISTLASEALDATQQAYDLKGQQDLNPSSVHDNTLNAQLRTAELLFETALDEALKAPVLDPDTGLDIATVSDGLTTLNAFQITLFPSKSSLHLESQQKPNGIVAILRLDATGAKKAAKKFFTTKDFQSKEALLGGRLELLTKIGFKPLTLVVKGLRRASNSPELTHIYLEPVMNQWAAVKAEIEGHDLKDLRAQEARLENAKNERFIASKNLEMADINMHQSRQILVDDGIAGSAKFQEVERLQDRRTNFSRAAMVSAPGSGATISARAEAIQATRELLDSLKFDPRQMDLKGYLQALAKRHVNQAAMDMASIRLSLVQLSVDHKELVALFPIDHQYETPTIFENQASDSRKIDDKIYEVKHAIVHTLAKIKVLPRWQRRLARTNRGPGRRLKEAA